MCGWWVGDGLGSELGAIKLFIVFVMVDSWTELFECVCTTRQKHKGVLTHVGHMVSEYTAYNTFVLFHVCSTGQLRFRPRNLHSRYDKWHFRFVSVFVCIGFILVVLFQTQVKGVVERSLLFNMYIYRLPSLSRVLFNIFRNLVILVLVLLYCCDKLWRTFP